ncbi:hypothetical protein [Deinococcus sp.]|nr:hypothetical protein [Deinococcus sp.]
MTDLPLSRFEQLKDVDAQNVLTSLEFSVNLVDILIKIIFC